MLSGKKTIIFLIKRGENRNVSVQFGGFEGSKTGN
jgi:hypothetical protein